MNPDPLRPYTSLERVQKETKNSDEKNRNWFAQCIMDASRIVDERTKRDFHGYVGTASEPIAVYSKWINKNKIRIPYPIQSLDAVLFEGEAIDPKEWAWENVGNLNKVGSVIYRKGSIYWSGNTDFPCFGPDYGVITLQGELGYGIGADAAASGSEWETLPGIPPGMPLAVQRATTLIAASLSGLNRKEVIDFEGNKEGFNEYRIPKEAEKLLKPYKLLTI